MVQTHIIDEIKTLQALLNCCFVVVFKNIFSHTNTFIKVSKSCTSQILINVYLSLNPTVSYHLSTFWIVRVVISCQNCCLIVPCIAHSPLKIRCGSREMNGSRFWIFSVYFSAHFSSFFFRIFVLPCTSK